jgi:hypothetical protein
MGLLGEKKRSNRPPSPPAVSLARAAVAAPRRMRTLIPRLFRGMVTSDPERDYGTVAIKSTKGRP